MKQFSIGTDAEFPLYRGETLVSAIDYIPGSKEHPAPMDFGDIQPDNIMVETGMPAAYSEDEWVSNVTHMMKSLKDFLQPLGLDFKLQSYVEVLEDNRKILLHPLARRAGCEPDFNAYSGKKNPKPRFKGVPARTAAGHVHIGWDCKGKEDVLVKHLDCRLGVPSLLIDPDGQARRALYGKAGAFRPKPYGLEYRSLGNFWYASEELIRWVYRGVKKAIDDTLDGVEPYPVQEIIDTNRVTHAFDLINELKLELP